MSKDMPDMSEEMPDGMSKDMPERMSEEMPDRMSKDMPERMSEEMITRSNVILEHNSANTFLPLHTVSIAPKVCTPARCCFSCQARCLMFLSRDTGVLCRLLGRFGVLHGYARRLACRLG